MEGEADERWWNLVADAHACKELHRRSHRFALQNFQEVTGTEEFLLLPFSEVRAVRPRPAGRNPHCSAFIRMRRGSRKLQWELRFRTDELAFV